MKSKENTIDEKEWFAFIVDGKVIGVVEDGAAFKREKKRLEYFHGIVITKAMPEDLIKFNCKTLLPNAMIKRMNYVINRNQ